MNRGAPLWFQVRIHHRLDRQREAFPLFDRARRPHRAVQPRHRKPNRIGAGIARGAGWLAVRRREAATHSCERMAETSKFHNQENRP